MNLQNEFAECYICNANSNEMLRLKLTLFTKLFYF